MHARRGGGFNGVRILCTRGGLAHRELGAHIARWLDHTARWLDHIRNDGFNRILMTLNPPFTAWFITHFIEDFVSGVSLLSVYRHRPACSRDMWFVWWIPVRSVDTTLQRQTQLPALAAMQSGMPVAAKAGRREREAYVESSIRN
jgi:hypothetical protein